MDGSATLTKCAGCNSNTNDIVGENRRECIKRGTYRNASVIKVEVLPYAREECKYRIITPVNLIKKCYVINGTLHRPVNEIPLNDIRILPLEETLIDRLISSDILAKELIAIHNFLSSSGVSEYTIYTDGSMDMNVRDTYNNIVMGSGWVVHNTDISFSCGIRYHPSSTRPELLAILTALIAIPEKGSVKIFTDSQAAIDGITHMHRRCNQQGRKLLKQNNYIILSAIWDVVRIKKLDFQIFKVKGHSGCKWNDKADYLAKTGGLLASLDGNRIIDLQYLFRFNVSLLFLPKWNNLEIDRNIRKFCELVSNTLEEVWWTCNAYWKDYFEQAVSQTSCDWNSKWRYIKSISHNACQSFDTNNDLIHFIKCSNNLLPTIDNLRKRSSLYDNVPCPSCLQMDESLQHILICDGTEDGFKQLEDYVTAKIKKYMEKITSKKMRIETVESTIFEYKDAAFPLLKERNRNELSRGLISSTIVKKLQRLTSKKVTNGIVQRILRYFHKAFRKFVWIPRCKKLIDLEISLNITMQQKKHNSATRPSNIQYNAMIMSNKKDILRLCMNRCKDQIMDSITTGMNQPWKSRKVSVTSKSVSNKHSNINITT
jgi:ribonuclease HI